jgi:hypothetical protein
MEPKATIRTLNFGLAKTFFCLAHTQYAVKNQNPRNQGPNDKKYIFFPVPMSSLKMGYLSVKKSSEKFHSWTP